MSICPRCNASVRYLLALSRRDNETLVCSPCGADEAMANLEGRDVWPGFPGLTTVRT